MPMRDDTVPVHARHDQAVEIHWRLADGSVTIEHRVSPADVPPLAACATDDAGHAFVPARLCVGCGCCERIG